MSDHPLITRTQAATAGLSRYYTGRPCKYGHSAQRYVASGSCVECSKLHQSKFSNDRREHRIAGAQPTTFLLHPDDVPTVRELVDALAVARGLAV